MIEKKRRDRINHNLEALRDLLFKNTAETVSTCPRFMMHYFALFLHYFLDKPLKCLSTFLSPSTAFTKSKTGKNRDFRSCSSVHQKDHKKNWDKWFVFTTFTFYFIHLNLVLKSYYLLVIICLIYVMFFNLSAVTSTQMDSKATQKQSVSTGPIYASDFYVPDFYGRFKSSEQKEVLLKLGVNHNNLTGASKTGNEPVAQTGFFLSPSSQNFQQKLLLNPESSLDGSKLLHQSTSPPSSSSSSQCSSPPSSPTFTSSSSYPSNSLPYLFMPCPLPAPSDSLSLLSTPLSLHRPVMVPQPILPNMARDFTPPQSPVLALRPEPFLFQPSPYGDRGPELLPWRAFPFYLGTAPMEKLPPRRTKLYVWCSMCTGLSLVFASSYY